MRVCFVRAQHLAWWVLGCLTVGIWLGTGGLAVLPVSTGSTCGSRAGPSSWMRDTGELTPVQ